ncbi:MAG: M14 family metallopeptidase [Myxococcota bacterium]|nr:M14 family metallopeptidase [Myxococcota bacterium]
MFRNLPLIVLLLSGGAQAGERAGFPHGAEPLPEVHEGPRPEDRPCNVAFSAWVRHQEPPAAHPPKAEGWGFSATLFRRILAVEESTPSMVHTWCIGRSVQGRPIWATRIARPDAPVEHRMLVFAQLHALEWIGAEVVVALAERLGQHTPKGIEIVLVPLVNPDGRHRAESDLLEEREGVYRRANTNGVDLNRDFAVHRESDNIWSRLPWFRRYYTASPAPLSQPETRALDKLASTGFDISVSLHAFGGVIYYPWAGIKDPIEDAAAHRAMARIMAAAQPGRSYRTVQLGRYFRWFRGLGMEIDHMYAVHGSQSFLIELTRSGIRPLRPNTWKDYFRWYNPVDPSPHVDDGVTALWAAITHYASQASSQQGTGTHPTMPQLRQEIPRP